MQGERIKMLRKKLGLTLEKFGERLGVTKAAISRIEKGERGLTSQMTKAICREFNVDFIWLTTGKGHMFQEKHEEVEILDFLEDMLFTYPNLKKVLARFASVATVRDLENLDDMIGRLIKKESEE